MAPPFFWACLEQLARVRVTGLNAGDRLSNNFVLLDEVVLHPNRLRFRKDRIPIN